MDEVEAVNWIIRNNYEIQCLLKENDVKQVVVNAYMAGQKDLVNKLTTTHILPKELLELLEDRIVDEATSRIDEDNLSCFDNILNKNL